MSKSETETIIVGVVLHSEELDNLQKLLNIFPLDLGIVLVIKQQFDSEKKNSLASFLEKYPALNQVKVANNTDEIIPNNAYLVDSDDVIEIESKKFKFIHSDHSQNKLTSIDHFFYSLIREYGDRSVGIILSGTGNDGIAGIRAIKNAGGLALVLNPDYTDYPDLPLNTIETGILDKVVTIEEIPKIIKNYSNYYCSMAYKNKDLGNTSLENLNEIVDILSTDESFNLNQYKSATVHRRIFRRMGLIGIEDHGEYVRMLKESEEEREKLIQDLMINVTEFFRDPEAFQALQNNVIPEILSKVEEAEVIRVWVAGCSSGEEAYTIAILLADAVLQSGKKNEIKIFATDIDEQAIKLARKGIYPESVIDEIPEKYLDAYFIETEDGTYQIKSYVRDLITFANQNVVNHPPFSHMHLISCRNLFIYLKKEIQETVLNSFYFSLKSEGYLFLGGSESVGDKAEFFRSISKKWRIFKKIPGLEKANTFLQQLHIDKSDLIKSNIDLQLGEGYKKSRNSISRAEKIQEALLATKVPPTIVVSQSGKVLYNHGNIKPYITVPTGEPSLDIIQLILPEIRSRLRSCLFKIKKTKENLSFHCTIPLNDNSKESRNIKVELSILSDEEVTDGSSIAISFYQQEIVSSIAVIEINNEDETKLNQSLELELAETKLELQNTVEELETNTEELKALHEEALSTNEELQSANEELEASSEELRSLNSEVNSINLELKDKIEALQIANNDVENFFTSTDIPVLFLNTKLEVQRYTPTAEHLLKMGPSDVGRPVSTLSRNLIDETLIDQCKKVLQNFQPIRVEEQTFDDKWYLRQITPYRTTDFRVNGVVVVFQDITEVKNLSRRAEAREQQQSVVSRLGMMALQGLDPKELMHSAVREVANVLNADFCKILKYQPENQNFIMVAGLGWYPGLSETVTIPNNYNSQAGYTILSKEPVLVKDLAKEKRFQGSKLLLDHGVVSGMSCIINSTDAPYGVISIHTKKYREFSKDDANFLLSVSSMISTAIKSRDTQERLHFSEVQFRTMANAIPQLAWITDETGYIYWYNQRWYDYTGTSLKDVEGWEWKNVHHPDHVDRVVTSISKSFKEGIAWEDTFPLRRADGVYRWFLSRAEPIKNKEGKVIKWLGTNTDITEQLNLENSLRNAVTKLEDTDKRKNEFLAILGHELRNPLAALSNSLDVLVSDKTPTKGVLEIMGRSIVSMSKILNDLLDLSRISRNKINLQLSSVNIYDLIQTDLSNVHKQFAAKNQVLELDVPEDLCIQADVTRVEQIFTNLLVNANKYTPERGYITVKAWKEESKVIIEITDNGVGIEKDKLERVFESFYQIPSAGKAASGLGIGLSLVKNLIELHEGEISVNSEGLNKGTTFKMSFKASDR